MEKVRNIVCLKLIDKYENEENVFYIIKDKDFDIKYKQLQELLKNYETYQDIEDFIYINFNLVDLETQELYY